MGKTALATPLYISFAWILMVSYQFFTQTAVTTVVTRFATFWPALEGWLMSRIDMIIFVYAFAWVFVLSSVIPSFILGKERSVLVQFLVCLTLTFLAFFVQDLLTSYGYDPIDNLSGLAMLLDNPILAVAYLSIPYDLMLSLDIHSRSRRNKKEQEKVVSVYTEGAAKEE